jgi:hypothetical protein
VIVAGIAQLAERLSCKERVEGSTPSVGLMKIPKNWKKIFNPFIVFLDFFDFMAWSHNQAELNRDKCKHDKRYERYPYPPRKRF